MFDRFFLSVATESQLSNEIRKLGDISPLTNYSVSPMNHAGSGVRNRDEVS